MMVRILEPGMFSTVQDLGRAGIAAMGVPLSGAADPLALTAGNAIVRNTDTDAAIEMTVRGATVSFDRPVLAAVAGTAELTLNALPVPCWSPLVVCPGDRLAVGRITSGVRAYLCVRGGIATPPVLASRATLVAAAIGGHEGRSLRAGDELPLGASRQHPRNPAPRITEAIEAAARRTLRIVPGAHADRFHPAALELLSSTEFTISPRSDRAGVRLTTDAAAGLTSDTGRMVSEGMMPGAIQVPSGGEPIILGPDGPTTGGYPVLAVVAAIDLPTLGQLAPRTRIRFEVVSTDGARILYRDRLARTRDRP